MHFYSKIGLFILFPLLITMEVHAQIDHFNVNRIYVAEVGLGLGASNYYGDLNAENGYQAVKPTAGFFFRYFFSSYFGTSLHIDYARLGYSDVYNKDPFRHRRNLSFNTDTWDFSLRGDFNFFQFEPGSAKHRFTPFLSLGLGVVHFNPYAYYQDQKYYLRPLGTEGQYSDAYPDRKPYPLWVYEIPIEIGVKYNLSRHWNLNLTATYHFTGSDYLDDVSTTYAGPGAFYDKGTPTQQIGALLQDRSGIYGLPIGERGRQRGDSRNKDQYVLVHFSISYLFSHYRCPF